MGVEGTSQGRCRLVAVLVVAAAGVQQEQEPFLPVQPEPQDKDLLEAQGLAATRHSCNQAVAVVALTLLAATQVPVLAAQAVLAKRHQSPVSAPPMRVVAVGRFAPQAPMGQVESVVAALALTAPVYLAQRTQAAVAAVAATHRQTQAVQAVPVL